MSQSVVARMLSPAVASSAVYLALWTSYALVTKAAIGNEGARFNKSGAIFLAELFKLVAVVLVYCLAPVGPPGATPGEKLRTLLGKAHLAPLYAVPGIVYMMTNALQFVSIAHFDPGTYRVLVNMRVVFTALLSQAVFGKRLNRNQWQAIVVLCVACTVSQMSPTGLQMVASVVGLAAVCAQSLGSSVAGVYFQWLVQVHGNADKSLNSWEKNAFLYFWGTAINAVVVLFTSPDFFTGADFQYYTPAVVASVALAAVGGFSTAVLLQVIGALLKEFVNAFEMAIITVMQYFVFGTPIRPALVLGVGLSIAALQLYHVQVELTVRHRAKSSQLPQTELARLKLEAAAVSAGGAAATTAVPPADAAALRPGLAAACATRRGRAQSATVDMEAGEELALPAPGSRISDVGLVAWPSSSSLVDSSADPDSTPV